MQSGNKLLLPNTQRNKKQWTKPEESRSEKQTCQETPNRPRAGTIFGNGLTYFCYNPLVHVPAVFPLQAAWCISPCNVQLHVNLTTTCNSMPDLCSTAIFAVVLPLQDAPGTVNHFRTKIQTNSVNTLKALSSEFSASRFGCCSRSLNFGK